MDPLTNATCRLIEPRQAQNTGDPLQREHSEIVHGAQRCSLRQLAIRPEEAVPGAALAMAWRCRLQSPKVGGQPLPIGPGWRLRLKLDGEVIWYDYEVLHVAKGLHHDLLLEKA